MARRNMKTGRANGRQPRLVSTAVRRSSSLNVLSDLTASDYGELYDTRLLAFTEVWIVLADRGPLSSSDR